MSAYILTFAGFFGLFLFTLSHTVLGNSGIESAGAALLCAGGLVVLHDFIRIIPTENLLYFLWRKFSKRRPLLLSHMMIVLSGPFVGVFTIQSSYFNGLVWFYGIINLVVLWLLFERFIDTAIERTRVDEY